MEKNLDFNTFCNFQTRRFLLQETSSSYFQPNHLISKSKASFRPLMKGITPLKYRQNWVSTSGNFRKIHSSWNLPSTGFRCRAKNTPLGFNSFLTTGKLLIKILIKRIKHVVWKENWVRKLSSINEKSTFWTFRTIRILMQGSSEMLFQSKLPLQVKKNEWDFDGQKQECKYEEIWLWIAS